MPGIGVGNTNNLSLISGIGGLIPGGSTIGTIGGVIGGIIGGTGGSKCKGPYNYVNGMCVPKSGFGSSYPVGGTPPSPGNGTSTVPLPPTPGVTTPGEYSTTGWDVGVDNMGRAFAAPMKETRQVSVCPPGWKLSKKGYCYEKIANAHRKYPKPPGFPLDRREMRALRAFHSAQLAAADFARKAGLKIQNPPRKKKR